MRPHLLAMLLTVCPSPTAEIRRPQTPSCWAGWDGVCLDRPAWQRWTDSGAACFEAQARSALVVPRRNSRPGTLALGPPPPRSIRRVTELRPLDRGTGISRLRAAFERLRERTDERLRRADASGLLSHLLTGSNAARESLGVLSILGLGGLSHLLALHWIGMGRFLFAVARRAAARAGFGVSAGLAGARALAALGGLFLWVLGGASGAAARPLLALALRETARFRGWRWRAGVPLGLAWGLEMAWAAFQAEPLDQMGPWLFRFAGSLAAFAAVTAAAGRSPISRGGPWRASFAAGAVCSLFIALSNHWLALGGTMVSAAFMPVFSTFLAPLALLGAGLEELGFAGGAGLLGICGRLISSLLLPALGLALRLPLQWILPPTAMAIALVPTALLWRAPRVLKALTLGTLITLRLAGSGSDPAPGPVVADTVEQLDVGQGDAALVRAPDWSGLIDAGPERALGAGDWIRLFAERGIARLDWIALSHLDADHAGGLRTLARWIPIRCVATAEGQLRDERGRLWRRELGDRGIPLRAWDGGCVPLSVLPPPPGPGAKRNGAMSAFFVPLRPGGFYLNAGDADAEDEVRAIPWVRQRAAETAPGPRLLKVSHHGSRFSSDPDFLRAVAPTEAWISVGLGNTYGHPSMPALERLRALGIPIRRTDLEGALFMNERQRARALPHIVHEWQRARALPLNYKSNRPPSTTRVSPVTQEASSDRR